MKTSSDGNGEKTVSFIQYVLLWIFAMMLIFLMNEIVFAFIVKIIKWHDPNFMTFLFFLLSLAISLLFFQNILKWPRRVHTTKNVLIHLFAILSIVVYGLLFS